MGRLKIFLTNLGKYVDGYLVGEWVKLPVPKDKLNNILTRIGINEQNNEEYFITDFDTTLANLEISEYASLDELNELAELIENLTDGDYEKLSAVLEAESPTTIKGIIEIIGQLDEFDLLAEVTTDEQIGEYHAEISCIFQGVPDHIQRYFNYKQYGCDIRHALFFAPSLMRDSFARSHISCDTVIPESWSVKL